DRHGDLCRRRGPRLVHRTPHEGVSVDLAAVKPGVVLDVVRPERLFDLYRACPGPRLGALPPLCSVDLPETADDGVPGHQTTSSDWSGWTSTSASEASSGKLSLPMTWPLSSSTGRTRSLSSTTFRTGTPSTTAISAPGSA